MGGAPSVHELACGVLSLRAERGLLPAVRSLLEQDEPLEIVVVNSGGGGARRKLIAAGIDVQVIEVPERLLPGAVRNLAIEATRAPYVSFLAADCVALPGWVAGRLREHRRGAVAVAGTMANAHPRSLSARAAYLLLHNRRMPETPPHMRLLYSLSYQRAVFERHGRFREDLLAGEDSEFNARLEPGAEIAWAPDVARGAPEPAQPGGARARPVPPWRPPDRDRADRRPRAPVERDPRGAAQRRLEPRPGAACRRPGRAPATAPGTPADRRWQPRLPSRRVRRTGSRAAHARITQRSRA